MFSPLSGNKKCVWVLLVSGRLIEFGNASSKPTKNRTMKKVSTIVTLCAIAALPMGAVAAETPSVNAAANTVVKAEKEETKTVELVVTGMR